MAFNHTDDVAHQKPDEGKQKDNREHRRDFHRLIVLHQEHAETIARLVEASALEATRQEKRPEYLKKLSQELKQSVEKFEASHPQLTAFVTEYSAILSALGI